MREHWTDDRMDDLAKRVDSGFSELHEDNRQLRREMMALRSELRADNKALATELRADNKTLADGLRAEIKALATEPRTEKTALADELRAEMKDQTRSMERRFDVLLGTILSGFGGLILTHFLG